MTTAIPANPDEKAHFLTERSDGSFTASFHTIIAWVIEYKNGSWIANPVFATPIPEGTTVIPLARKGTAPITYTKEQLRHSTSWS
jgi:hypothetical protein